MQTTVSSKYQIVIPKDIRRKLGIKPGQKLLIKRVNKKVVIDTGSVVDKYAGSLAEAWGGEDPVKVIRQLRDQDRS